MSDSTLWPAATTIWSKVGIQRAVEAVFNTSIFEPNIENAVCLKRFPRSLQLDGHSCGTQVLRSVLSYYGIYEESFDLHWELRRGGTNTEMMCSLLQEYGLSTSEFSNARPGTLRRMINRGEPALVGLDDDRVPHWAVVYGYGRGHIYVMDPSLWQLPGRVMTTDGFLDRWDGWGVRVYRE